MNENSIKWWDLLSPDIDKEYKSHDEQLRILKLEYDNMCEGMKAVWAMADDAVYRHKELYESYGEIHDSVYRGRVSYNLSKYCVSSLFNKVGTKAPKATFITKDKGYKEQKVAIQLDKWMLDVFKKCEVKEPALHAILSALITGWGVVKIYKKGKKVRVSHVDNTCFYVNEPASRSHHRDQMGSKKMVPFYKLLEKFGKDPILKEKLLEEYGTNLNKMIEIYSIYKAHKACAIFTRKVILKLEKYKAYPPYKIIRWQPAISGFFPEGVTEELRSFQDKIIYILEKVSENLARLPSSIIFLPAGSGIQDSEISGEGGTIYTYTGNQPPTIETPPVINPQYFQHLEETWQKALQQIGITENYATGEIPKALRSGVAVQNYHDLGSERFINFAENVEKFYIHIAKCICELASMYPELLPEQIRHVDLKMEMENVQVYPTNFLPETPSGQLETGSNMVNSGLITSDDFLSLLENPDLKHIISSKNNRRRAIDHIISMALDKKEEIVVDEALNVNLFLDRLQDKYADLVREDAKEYKEELALLSTAIYFCTEKIKQEMQIEQALQLLEQVKQQQG